MTRKLRTSFGIRAAFPSLPPLHSHFLCVLFCGKEAFSKTANEFAVVQGIFPCRGVGGREALILFVFAAAVSSLTELPRARAAAPLSSIAVYTIFVIGLGKRTSVPIKWHQKYPYLLNSYSLFWTP